MSRQGGGPTPYPYVNEVLQALLANVGAILGERFYGLYLYGSLASGDFNPRRSDIDFLVVTEGLLPEEMIAALDEMHAQMAASGGVKTIWRPEPGPTTTASNSSSRASRWPAGPVTGRCWPAATSTSR